jgi:Rrf2 family protein
MIKINKKVEYALVAIKHMALKQEEELTSAREICDIFKTPFDTTAKVLQIMNNHGMLSSVKGIKGGYQLSVSLRDITYLQLVQMIENKKNSLNSAFCESTKGTCELYSTCNIIEPIEMLNDKINQFLQSLTLEELLLREKISFPLPQAMKNLERERGQTKGSS